MVSDQESYYRSLKAYKALFLQPKTMLQCISLIVNLLRTIVIPLLLRIERKNRRILKNFQPVSYWEIPMENLSV